MLPEGYGALELLQFTLALAGLVITVRLRLIKYVKGWRLLKIATVLFAAACLYIAGEEQSWGQHFFQWKTPEFWSKINNQNETNLHNAFGFLDRVPHNVLEFVVVFGGIVLPLWCRIMGPVKSVLLVLFAPSPALAPTAACAVSFRIINKAGDHQVIPILLGRSSEVVETFFYLFILFYLIVFSRRISALDAMSSDFRRSVRDELGVQH